MANTQDGPGERAERNPRESRAAGGERARVSARGEADRTGYPTEERYWTDYLRVALPVLGLLLLVGLLWYWASAIIGDNSAEAPAEPSAIALVTPIAPATPPAAVQPTTAPVQPTPGLPPVSVATQPAVAAAPTQAVIVPPTVPAAPAITPVVQATQPPEPAVIDGDNPCSGLPAYEIGTTVATTDEVNLRDTPSTEGAAIRVLPPGTLLTTTAEAVEAGQCDWWPVTVNETGEQGFVIEQYVRLGE